MSWCNNYTRPVQNESSITFNTSLPYDINCAIPINEAVLENERIKLTPFIPHVHSSQFLEQITKHPQLFHYLPFPRPTTPDEVDFFISNRFQSIPGHILFAIHDKTRPLSEFDQAVSGGGSFGGVIALINTSIPDLSTEIGYVIIFPEYQRTHVLSNAAGLLIRYCLSLPSDSEAPGIGYRRVQWLANSENSRSIHAAERMGFWKEGTIRWHRVLPEGKEGHAPREEDPAGSSRPGRHTVILSICWDDWVKGTREKLEGIMNRK